MQKTGSERYRKLYKISKKSTAEKFQVLSSWLWAFILFEGARGTAEWWRVRFRFFIMQYF